MMDDATQKLVDEARRQARILIRTGHGVEGRTLYERLADALEAAQRPPISPEVREEMFRLLYDASGSQFMKHSWRRSMVIEQRDAILARFSVPSRPQVSPEQREETARTLFVWDTDEHPDPRPVWSGLSEAQRDVWRSGAEAILARFTIPVLDAEKVARCLARADGTDYDVETDGLRMSYDTLAAALVAAIQNGELT